MKIYVILVILGILNSAIGAVTWNMNTEENEITRDEDAENDIVDEHQTLYGRYPKEGDNHEPNVNTNRQDVTALETESGSSSGEANVEVSGEANVEVSGEASGSVNGEATEASAPERPNIIFILADDLGWADVSWNDPRIFSPNLHKLYNKSLILQNYYVQQVCSPSRAAIMTGRYPFHLGLQSGVIHPSQPGYLPLNVSTFPEELKKLGYATHAVGKWHLGYCHKRVTPTFRGFDSFYGFWLGSQDHYTHCKSFKGSEGLDYRDDLKIVRDQRNVYSVHSHTARAVKVIEEHNATHPLYLYLPYQNVHDPAQVPLKYIRTNRLKGHFSGKRLVKAAMVTALDEGVANITRALKRKGIFDKAIIIFSTDNGGPVQLASLNFPYRGSKGTLYEGGTKAVGFIKGPMFKHSNFTGLLHAVDWFPTLLKAAGSSSQSEIPLDGIDQWRNLLHKTSSRSEFIYNIDEVKGRAGIRVGQYKLLVGRQGGRDGWYTDETDVRNNSKTSKLAHIPKRPGFPRKQDGVMLFDLVSDPYEYNDISDQSPDIVTRLYNRLRMYKRTLVPSIPKTDVKKADPKFYNGTWSYGWCKLPEIDDDVINDDVSVDDDDDVSADDGDEDVSADDGDEDVSVGRN